MKVAVLLNAGAGTMARLGPQGAGRVADVFRDRGVEAEVAALPGARIARAIGKLTDSREERDSLPSWSAAATAR